MSLGCPRCCVELQEGQAQEMVVHACARCGGIWLDKQGAARVAQALLPQVLALADQAAQQARRTVNEAPHISCPECAEILLRTTVVEAGVATDRCPDHGVWYDRNELQRIAEALSRVRQQRQPRQQATAAPQKPQRLPEPPQKPPQKPPPAKVSPPPTPKQPRPRPVPPPPDPVMTADPAQRKDSDTLEAGLEVAAVVIDLLLSFL